MEDFEVGSLVRVKKDANRSGDGKRLRGRVGRILRVHTNGEKYAILDIEGNIPGGIWFSELEGVGGFQVGDRVRCKVNRSMTDVVELLPGMAAYEAHSYIDAHRGMVLKKYGWSFQNNWEIIEWGEDMDMSKYNVLKGRIDAISGSTNLQEFGELLLELNEGSGKRVWLEMPCQIGSNGSDCFVLSDVNNKHIDSGTTPKDACGAITALKTELHNLLGKNEAISKDEKADKIEQLKKEMEESNKKFMYRIRELESK